LKHTLYQKAVAAAAAGGGGGGGGETNLSLKPEEQAIDLFKLTEGNVRSSKRVGDTESHKRSKVTPLQAWLWPRGGVEV